MRAVSRTEKIAALFLPRIRQGGPHGVAVDQRPMRFVRAQASLSAFYACIAFFAASNLFTWKAYLDVTTLDPRWPIFWLRWVDLGGPSAVLESFRDYPHLPREDLSWRTT